MSIYDKASLVLIPSGTKTSKVYSQKPTNGDGDFTFSRSTAATRVNASGNIEKETQNLLLQSNQFDTTWTLDSGMTLTNGQSGYDGSSDAWLLSKPAASYREMVQSISLSGVNTYSIYAKAGTLTNVTLRFISTSGNHYARFNLSTGAVISTTGNVFDTNVEDIGSGWYRCSATANVTASSVYVYPDIESNNTAGNIYIQDAQLEQGLVARDYIETTTTAIYGGITDNVPRLDYTDSSCPSILLEPQRTNVATHSEYLDGLPKTGMTITPNATTSPEGVDNASKIAYLSGQAYVTGGSGLSAGTTYTFSGFFKANDSDYIIINNAGAGATNAFYNLANGTHSGGTGITTDMIDYGNGWYRLIYTFNVLYNAIRIYMSGNGSYGNYPSVGEGFFAWGFQTEQASYATSYIPTYGSAVTRNEDSCIKTGVSSLLNTSEGSIFLEINTPDNALASKVFTIGDSTANRIQVFYYGDSIRMNFISGGTTYAYFNHALTDVNDTIKVAIAYATNDIVMYVNGALTNSDNGATMPSVLSYVKFDNGSGGAKFIGKVNQALLFKTRLTNAELATLTTI